VKRILLTALAVVALVPTAPVAADAAKPAGATTTPRPGAISVGTFLVEMARMVDPDAPEGLAPPAAVARLRLAGVELPADIDHDADLTQGHVVGFARAFGLDLKSLDPDAIFPAAQIEALAALLQGDAYGGSDAVPSALGSAAGLDRGGSTPDPAGDN
jgi:hypothetical protein